MPDGQASFGQSKSLIQHSTSTFFSHTSISAAAVFPAPMALITVALQLVMSPPAQTLHMVVRPLLSTTKVPHLVVLKLRCAGGDQQIGNVIKTADWTLKMQSRTSSAHFFRGAASRPAGRAQRGAAPAAAGRATAAKLQTDREDQSLNGFMIFCM